jgi:hypothetical protein
MDFAREPEPTKGESAREERIKRLMLAAVPRCGACRRSYTVADFAIIGHREQLWMIAVRCGGCQHQGFITAVVERQGPEERHAPRASRAEPFTEERVYIVPDNPVTVDDLLDLHDFLDDFNGDFAGLFARHEGPASGRRD